MQGEAHAKQQPMRLEEWEADQTSPSVAEGMSALATHQPLLAVPPMAVMTHGNPRLPEVALTFDDGPGPYTPEVLAVLQRYNASATFFQIGNNIVRASDSLYQDLTAVSTIGNHTFTHPHLSTLSYPDIYQELSETQRTIQQATGNSPTLFRPPFGEYNSDVLTAASQLGLTVVTWSVEAGDWHNPQPTASQIAASILGAADNGAIFLLHDAGGNRANTVAALPTIIEGLQAGGFRLVTLTQMMANLQA